MGKIYYPQSEKALPRSIYMRVIYFIKDYPRMLEDAEMLLEGTPDQTETPEIQRQRNIRATETTNIKFATVMADIRLINEALEESVPPSDRQAIIDNIVNGRAYPIAKSKRTYAGYKSKFLHKVAEKLHLI